MITDNPIISMETHFSNQNQSGTGFLLSMDEVQLIKNMALSLKEQEDKDFLNTITEKEFITADEKELMQQIYRKAANRIKKEASLTA